MSNNLGLLDQAPIFDRLWRRRSLKRTWSARALASMIEALAISAASSAQVGLDSDIDLNKTIIHRIGDIGAISDIALVATANDRTKVVIAGTHAVAYVDQNTLEISTAVLDLSNVQPKRERDFQIIAGSGADFPVLVQRYAVLVPNICAFDRSGALLWSVTPDLPADVAHVIPLNGMEDEDRELLLLCSGGNEALVVGLRDGISRRTVSWDPVNAEAFDRKNQVIRVLLANGANGFAYASGSDVVIRTSAGIELWRSRNIPDGWIGVLMPVRGEGEDRQELLLESWGPEGLFGNQTHFGGHIILSADIPGITGEVAELNDKEVSRLYGKCADAVRLRLSDERDIWLQMSVISSQGGRVGLSGRTCEIIAFDSGGSKIGKVHIALDSRTLTTGGVVGLQREDRDEAWVGIGSELWRIVPVLPTAERDQDHR